MKTKALICNKRQEVFLEEVQLPEISDGQIGVRTAYSGISVGTEFALIRNRISWGDFPIVTGYQAVGIVERVGDRVQNYQPGDWVYFRGNNASMKRNTGEVCSCVGGTHASYALIDALAFPDSLGRLPENVCKKTASTFVMPSVGLHGVDMAQPKTGDLAVVIGAGLIGLGAINALANRGCRVLAADTDPLRLQIALHLGAEAICDVRVENTKDFVSKYDEHGANLVMECTGLSNQIVPSMELCARFGKFVYQGNYGSDPYQALFLPPHGRQLTCYYPCDDGGVPCRQAVFRLMSSGSLPWEKVITHVVPANEAPAIYHAINQGTLTDLVGGVIDWSAI